MLPDTGANATLDASDLPEEVFRPSAHLHLSGYPLLHPESRDAAFAAMGMAREIGMTISVDPSSVALLEGVGPGNFLDWTVGVDLLLANADEARVLSGQTRPARPPPLSPPSTARSSSSSATRARSGTAGSSQRAPPPSAGSRCWTPPAPATRSRPGSSRPGCCTPSPSRHWPPATAWPPVQSASSAAVPERVGRERPAAPLRGARRPRHADGHDQPASPGRTVPRHRRLRGQARRRVPDVEPVHRRRDRAGAPRAGRGVRCRPGRRRRWSRARLHGSDGPRGRPGPLADRRRGVAGRSSTGTSATCCRTSRGSRPTPA